MREPTLKIITKAWRTDCSSIIGYNDLLWHFAPKHAHNEAGAVQLLKNSENLKTNGIGNDKDRIYQAHCKNERASKNARSATKRKESLK